MLSRMLAMCVNRVATSLLHACVFCLCNVLLLRRTHSNPSLVYVTLPLPGSLTVMHLGGRVGPLGGGMRSVSCATGVGGGLG